MSQADNKQIFRDFLQSVWIGGDLEALPNYWTADCLNHAMAGPNNRGLEALRLYHEGFLAAFSGFSDIRMEITQQIAEADKVVTQTATTAKHSGQFMGIAATDKSVFLAAIRIDRFAEGKIAEHWSVSDLAGLMPQLQS